jgi:hypothetical protein
VQKQSDADRSDTVAKELSCSGAARDIVITTTPKTHASLAKVTGVRRYQKGGSDADSSD